MPTRSAGSVPLRLPVLPIVPVLVGAWATPPASAQVSLAEEPALAALHRALPSRPWMGPVELADLDQDGDLDALAAVLPPVLFSPEVVLFENDGHARFTERASWPGIRATGFHLDDLDRDGDTDVLVGTFIGDSSVLLNDGSGALEARWVQIDPVYFRTATALGDMDSDGDPDALIGAWSGVFLARNRGDATFEPGVLIGSSAGTVDDLAVADLDGDGDLDVASRTSGIRLLLNDGGGAFAETILWSTNYLGTVEAGDVDRNGAVDLVFLDFDLHLFLNRGAATFYDASDRIPPLVDYADDLVLADVDGNRSLDLVLGRALFLNDGSGLFKDVSLLLPDLEYGQIANVAVGDLDRDKDVDLVLGGASRVLLREGRGSFHDADLQEPLDAGAPVGLEDLDGDGDLDALAAGYELELLENDGRGVFSEREGAIPDGVGYGEPRFGDLDGDGDPDAFIVGTNRTLLNDGAGSFSLAGVACRPASSGYTMDATLGDLDGDGDLDVFLAKAAPGPPSYEGGSYYPAPDALWRNDGTGCFADASASLPPIQGVTFAAELGDVDAEATSTP